MKIIKTVLFSLFGLLVINGGLSKWVHYMPTPENLPEALVKDNLAFAEISWLMPLVGLAEMVGGLLILIPRTRALGVLIIIPVMVGVLLTHITVAPEGLLMVFIIWAMILWLIIDNKEKYLPLIRKTATR